MVFSGNVKDTRVVIVNCNCGCDEAIQIKRFVFEDESINDEYYLSVLAGTFGERQRGIFKIIGHRLKLAVKMLLGKEYLLSEIVLSKDEFEELKNKLKEF